MIMNLLLAATVAIPAARLTALHPAPLQVAAQATAGPVDSLYRAGHDAINRGNFRRAATIFGDINAKYPRSEYAGDALYWRAFALYRSGREEDLRAALKALETQRDRFPRATTSDDAEALTIRIRGVLAQQGDVKSAEAVAEAASPQRAQPCVRGGDEDNDMRIAAMNAL